MTRALALRKAKLFQTACAAALLALGQGNAPELARAEEIVTVGTGGVGGVYYVAGGAMCRLVNAYQEFHRLRCLVEPTSGSVDNASRVVDGRLQFGLVQSDVQWKAWNGNPPFEKPATALRSVLSIYPESVVLAASRSSGITGLADLRGRRVNLGAEGSGTRQAAADALRSAGITEQDLAHAGNIGIDELRSALRRGELDAFFLLAGHPSELLNTILRGWDGVLIPLQNRALDAMIAVRPFYLHAEIPGGLYPGADRPVPTFAVMATLVTSAEVSEATVYNFVKSVWISRDAFHGMHPALAAFTRTTALLGGSAPMHKGACRYFLEAGLECAP